MLTEVVVGKKASEPEAQGAKARIEDVKKRLAALASEVDAATRLARGAVDDAMKATTTARGSADRLAALGVEHARERSDIDQLGERGLEIERIIRQLELRIGDLAERQTGTREDLAALAARMGQLELTAAPPAQASTHDRAEGH
jgi:chromosome segregation ATPase